MNEHEYDRRFDKGDRTSRRGALITGILFAVIALLAVVQCAHAVTNLAPTITGTPATTATVGVAYSFTPTAKDPEGKKLSFVIKNRPSWLSFSYSTGSIKGTPTSANVGTYSGIVIYAKDGVNTKGLPAFSIKVTAATTATTGSASLSWTAPTKNVDETTLTDLKSYKIYYGTSASDLSKTIDAGNVTSYKVDSLAAGTWYFAVTAVNSAGAESAKSSVASKKIG